MITKDGGQNSKWTGMKLKLEAEGFPVRIYVRLTSLWEQRDTLAKRWSLAGKMSLDQRELIR